MNTVTLWGRLARDPVIKWVELKDSQEKMCIARYTLAVNRPFGNKSKDNSQTADFIPCVTFGKNAEIAQKMFRKGTALVINGRLNSGSYTNKEGQKVFFLDVQVDRQEFTERKAVQEQKAEADASKENKTSVEEDLPQPYTPEDMGMTFYPEDGSEQEPEQNFMEFGMEM